MRRLNFECTEEKEDGSIHMKPFGYLVILVWIILIFILGPMIGGPA